jgi:hypothetical protein
MSSPLLNDSTRAVGPWPPLRAARIVAALIATATLAPLAAGCGSSAGSHVAQLGSTETQSSSSGPSPTSAPVNGALAFSRCMRSHGVPSWPDPDSGGSFPVSAKHIATSNPGFPSAQAACGRLLPSAGQPGPPSQAVLRLAWSDSRDFARCMRSHGVSSWPNPTSDPLHHPERPTFSLQSVGVDQASSQIASTIRECEPLLHGWVPYVSSAAGTTLLGGS